MERGERIAIDGDGGGEVGQDVLRNHGTIVFFFEKWSFFWKVVIFLDV